MSPSGPIPLGREVPVVDKLQAWAERIERPPRDEVASIEYIELLIECRIIEAPRPR